MPQDPLDQLERLHQLHLAGALTDAEFEAQKQRILAGDPLPAPETAAPDVTPPEPEAAAPPPELAAIDPASIEVAPSEPAVFAPAPPRTLWPFYIAGGVFAVLLAVAVGILIAGNPKPTDLPTPTPRASATAPARSPEVRLADAFEAATGKRATFEAREGDDVVTTTPLRIVDLPFGPALLTKREIKDGCHACTGAIGVYYLNEANGKTTVTGRWPKAVEGWGWGAAPDDWSLTSDYTANPAIYASGGFTGQGITESSATLTELRPEGPITSDVIGTGFSNGGAVTDDGDGPAPCEVTGRIANIQRDQSFDVVISGSVTGVDHYVKKGGRFVATDKIDWGIPCDSGE